MLEVRRGRSSWMAPILLFLAVLLVAALAYNVANLDTSTGTVPTIPDVGNPPSGAGIPFPVEVFQIAFASLLVLLLAALVLTLSRRQRRRVVVRYVSRWDLIGTAVTVLILLALAFAWPDIARNLGPSEDGGSAPGGSDGGSLTWPAGAGAPVGILLAGGVFLAVLVVSYVLRGSPLLRLARGAEIVVPEREAAAAAVSEAIAELEIGGDVRTAILACFQRFCRLLDARGVSAQAPMTPRELEHEAVSGLGVPSDAAESLTSLFEEARYSVHGMGDADRERSLRSLEAIRAALEG